MPIYYYIVFVNILYFEGVTYMSTVVTTMAQSVKLARSKKW